MAGGVGSRFWPLSKETMPKQFLDVLGFGRTLIQQTYDRFSSFIPDENFLVVTNEQYVELVAEQLPQLQANHILAEPMMRNTAPCIAYAVKKIEAENPDAAMIITPADHVIGKEYNFKNTINRGLAFVAQKEAILTIGITPSEPNTGYGYIEYNKHQNKEGEPTPVEQFREKPSKEVAEHYLAQGNFSWNSGMFLWSVATIKKAFDKHSHTIFELFDAPEGVYGTEREKGFIEEIYPKCPKISIDYAILERAKNVWVINADLGWSDVGTWLAVEEHVGLNANGNAIVNGEAISKNSKGNIVYLPSGKKLVMAGVQDLVIVDEGDVLMIVTREHNQHVKELRADAGEAFGKEVM
jgi:mannose-1-phosphate guanylyltransferase